MTPLRLLPILAAALLALNACSNRQQNNFAYTVDCSVADSALHKDCATLFVVMDEYGQLRRLEASRGKGSFHFEGHLDRPRAAMLRFDRDTVPFYFVLESGHTRIDIRQHQWQIDGGPNNLRYTSLLAHHQRLADAIAQNAAHYRATAADSTLTPAKEREMATRDSLLRDSLARFTDQLATTASANCATQSHTHNDPVALILTLRQSPKAKP